MTYRNLLNLFTTLGLMLIMAAILIGLPIVALAQAPTGTAFTYQGWLQYGTTGITGMCSFEFKLFDAPDGGVQLGPTVSKTGVTVTNGYFTVLLDFGNVFTTTPRYMAVENVNCGNPGDPITLNGRIPLNPTIYAVYALTATTAASVDWANITNKPAGFADNRDDGVSITCANNQTLYWAGGAWACTNVLNDHGGLTGLEYDDHPQYLRVDGTRPMSGNLRLGSNRIINLAQATANGEAVPYEQALKNGDSAGGDLSGTYRTAITVTRLQGQPITSTLPLTNQVFTWDGSQWRPADPQAGGPASGDLAGTYPNPTVSRLQGRAVAPISPLDKQALRWNSVTNRWEPADVVSLNDVAGGDLAGTYPNPTVNKLQGRLIFNSVPTNKQVLTWNGVSNRWEAADPHISGPASGDLAGNYPNPTVTGLQGRPVAGSTPSNKQLLTWNGSQWVPAEVTHLQGRPVANSAPSLGQVLAWDGSQWVPAEVTHLQERPVANSEPSAGQVLIWDGSQWMPSEVLKSGDGAGGDLEGTYPNPRLKSDTIGMNELNSPMGYGTGTGQFSTSDTATDLYIIPSGAGFVPDTEGQCLVTVHAYIKNTTDGYATSDPVPYLRTAKQVGNGSPVHDGDQPIWFAPDDVTKYQSIMASAGFVWPIVPSDINQSVQFGCYIIDQPGDWDTDETVYCRVSYLCQ